VAQRRSALNFVRAQLITESCLSGLAAPIEGVTVDVKSQAILEQDIARARRYGLVANSASTPIRSMQSTLAFRRARRALNGRAA
jgi:citrate lyase subunit beta / citryl-CoA lyase